MLPPEEVYWQLGSTVESQSTDERSDFICNVKYRLCVSL